MQKKYSKSVDLLLNCLPIISNEPNLVLKGGTAINFFHGQYFPRLSMDIELAYVPIEETNLALNSIENILLNIKSRIEKHLAPITIIVTKNTQLRMTGLIVNKNGVEIKIDTNYSLSGAICPMEYRDLAPNIAKIYRLSLKNVPVLSYEDCYAEKFCSALDGQHPRDLFDVSFMIESRISEKLKNTFIVYLLCNNRPLHELLDPNVLNFNTIDYHKFSSMELKAITDARLKLIKKLVDALTAQDKAFILSIKRGKPLFELFPLEVAHLPGIQWRLMNIQRMSTEKREEQLKRLESLIEGVDESSNN